MKRASLPLRDFAASARGRNRQTGDQSQLFYLFNLERRIPAGHFSRRISPVVTRILVELREKLAPFIARLAGLRSIPI